MINKPNHSLLSNMFTGAICLIAIILFVTKIMSPFLNTWNEQSKLIKEKQALVIESNELLNNKTNTLNKDFKNLSEEIQSRLKPEHKENVFLAEIAKVSKESFVHIAAMNPRSLRDLGEFNELSVEIEMEANLGNLVRFLYQLRQSSVVLVAHKIHLKPKSERSALLKGDLVISTIFPKN